MSKNKTKGNSSKKVIFSSVTALYLFCALIVVIGFVILFLTDEDYSIRKLLQDLLGNLIGVLAAFLLFDILYNKLTKDAYAEEVSSQISKTIMGDPDVLSAFSDEDRMNFIHSTIKSVDSSAESLEMLDGKIKQYLGYDDENKRFNLYGGRVRRSFGYDFDLDTEMPFEEAYKEFPKEKYFYVQEKLEYSVRGPLKNGKHIVESLNQKDNLGRKVVKMAFLFEKRHLDNALLREDVENTDALNDNRKQLFANCIFTESLDVDIEGLKYLDGIKDNVGLISKLFTPVIRIDGVACPLDNATLLINYGILLFFNADEVPEKDEHTVKLVFHMPKLWDSIMEVTLVDPTRSPKITFNYKPDRMIVSMYPYLNTEEESNDGAYEETNGLFDISIKDGEWVYPKSGVVFHVRKKKK